MDRRLGSNEDYLRLINKAHQKGLRVVMDMIFNHIGANHPWVLDVPSKDWFNVSPSKRGIMLRLFSMTIMHQLMILK